MNSEESVTLYREAQWESAGGPAVGVRETDPLLFTQALNCEPETKCTCNPDSEEEIPMLVFIRYRW